MGLTKEKPYTWVNRERAEKKGGRWSIARENFEEPQLYTEKRGLGTNTDTPHRANHGE